MERNILKRFLLPTYRISLSLCCLTSHPVIPRPFHRRPKLPRRIWRTARPLLVQTHAINDQSDSEQQPVQRADACSSIHGLAIRSRVATEVAESVPIRISGSPGDKSGPAGEPPDVCETLGNEHGPTVIGYGEAEGSDKIVAKDEESSKRLFFASIANVKKKKNHVRRRERSQDHQSTSC